MKFALKDGAPRSGATVELNVSKDGNTLEIGPVGVEPAPVVLEFYSGKLTLRLFGEDGSPTVVQNVSLAATAPVVATVPAKLGTATQEESFDEAAFDAA